MAPCIRSVTRKQESVPAFKMSPGRNAHSAKSTILTFLTACKKPLSADRLLSLLTPRSVFLCLCHSLPLCFSLSLFVSLVSLSVFLTLPLSLYLSLSLSLTVFLTLSVSLSLSSLLLSVCLSVFLSVCLSLSRSFSLSFYLSPFPLFSIQGLWLQCPRVI